MTKEGNQGTEKKGIRKKPSAKKKGNQKSVNPKKKEQKRKRNEGKKAVKLKKKQEKIAKKQALKVRKKAQKEAQKAEGEQRKIKIRDQKFVQLRANFFQERFDRAHISSLDDFYQNILNAAPKPSMAGPALP